MPRPQTTTKETWLSVDPCQGPPDFELESDSEVVTSDSENEAPVAVVVCLNSEK